MKFTGKEIEEYFQSIDLMESLVLEFEFKEKRNQLELVLDVPRDAVQDNKANIPVYDKAWMKFVFSGIISYRRLKGTETLLLKNLNDYSLKREHRNKVIHFLDVKSIDESCRLEVDFGDFGIAKLKFTEVNVSVRYGKAKKELQGWSYVDAVSGTAVEYFDPFGKYPDQKNITFPENK
jgi:hypothetical protein